MLLTCGKSALSLVVILATGDGRNDSPGSSAKYCAYTLMDVDTEQVVHCEIVDKREVALKSPNMERLGLKRSLENLRKSSVTLSELVTDASIVIISMIGKYR